MIVSGLPRYAAEQRSYTQVYIHDQQQMQGQDTQHRQVQDGELSDLFPGLNSPGGLALDYKAQVALFSKVLMYK